MLLVVCAEDFIDLYLTTIFTKCYYEQCKAYKCFEICWYYTLCDSEGLYR